MALCFLDYSELMAFMAHDIYNFFKEKTLRILTIEIAMASPEFFFNYVQKKQSPAKQTYALVDT